MKKSKYGIHQKAILKELIRRGRAGCSFDELHVLIQLDRGPSYLVPILLRLGRYHLIQIDWDKSRVKIGTTYDKNKIARYTKEPDPSGQDICKR
jgi:hypothetical protein